VKDTYDLQKAVTFAQYQLLLEIRSRGFNALWHEGCASCSSPHLPSAAHTSDSWRLTILRNACEARMRVEVRYTGRPAYLNLTPGKTPPPPFINVLEHMELIAQ